MTAAVRNALIGSSRSQRSGRAAQRCPRHCPSRGGASSNSELLSQQHCGDVSSKLRTRPHVVDRRDIRHESGEGCFNDSRLGPSSLELGLGSPRPHDCRRDSSESQSDVCELPVRVLLPTPRQAHNRDRISLPRAELAEAFLADRQRDLNPVYPFIRADNGPSRARRKIGHRHAATAVGALQDGGSPTSDERWDRVPGRGSVCEIAPDRGPVTDPHRSEQPGRRIQPRERPVQLGDDTRQGSKGRDTDKTVAVTHDRWTIEQPRHVYKPRRLSPLLDADEQVRAAGKQITCRGKLSKLRNRPGRHQLGHASLLCHQPRTQCTSLTLRSPNWLVAPG